MGKATNTFRKFHGKSVRQKQPRHHESDLQISMVDYFDRCVPKGAAYLFAVPNGGARDAVGASILKAEGTRPGVADMILLLPGGRVRFLEVKLDKVQIGTVVLMEKTYQEAPQKAFESAVTALGFRYDVIRSLDAFVAVLEEEGVPLTARPALSFRRPS